MHSWPVCRANDGTASDDAATLRSMGTATIASH
jgi:hypothetical protein